MLLVVGVVPVSIFEIPSKPEIPKQINPCEWIQEPENIPHTCLSIWVPKRQIILPVLWFFCQIVAKQLPFLETQFFGNDRSIHEEKWAMQHQIVEVKHVLKYFKTIRSFSFVLGVMNSLPPSVYETNICDVWHYRPLQTERPKWLGPPEVSRYLEYKH